MAAAKKVDLVSFLRRRRDTLAALCSRMAVRDYDDLCDRLDALGLSHPTREQCEGLFITKKNVSASTDASASESVSSSKKKKKRSKKDESTST